MIDEPGMFGYLVEGFLVLVPILAGAGFIVAAVRRRVRHRRLSATGERATAVVVDNQVESRGDGETLFRPVVEFTTATGNRLRTVVPGLGKSRSHLVGAPIAVVFDPESPAAVMPAEARTGAFVFAIGFGVFFIVFGLIAYTMITVLDPF